MGESWGKARGKHVSSKLSKNTYGFVFTPKSTVLQREPLHPSVLRRIKYPSRHKAPAAQSERQRPQVATDQVETPGQWPAVQLKRRPQHRQSNHRRRRTAGCKESSRLDRSKCRLNRLKRSKCRLNRLDRLSRYSTWWGSVVKTAAALYFDSPAYGR